MYKRQERERAGIIKNLPCLINNNYIDDNNIRLPVERVSVLVTADVYCDKNLNDMIEIINTDGDLTKNDNVYMIYDKVIRGGNPEDYYYGTMEYINLYGYYTNDSHMMCINKIEMCYIKIRLIFDDGGWI